jgi:hypothetical protein
MRAYGSHGQVSTDHATEGTPAPVLSLNKWSLSMSRAKADVTCFGDTNMVYVVGLPDIKGSVGGFYDEADLTLFDIALGNTPVTITLEPNTLETPTQTKWEGLAYLDANIDVPATGAIAVTGTFVAAGPWTMAPAPTKALTAPGAPPIEAKAA